MTRHYDYLAIGAGSGGIASANRAAIRGAKAAVIEAKAVGGTCVNVGCVPKKVMWYGAHIAEAIKYSEAYGFDLKQNGFDWGTLVRNREAYIERIHGGYKRGFESNGVEYIEGFARFVDKNTVEVNGEKITADHITIAVGGRAIIPSCEGAEYGIDSDGFFALEERPNKAVVVGAGYIAVEIAGVLHALGADSHLLVRRDRPLRYFDEDITDALLERLAQDGPTLHTNGAPQLLNHRSSIHGCSQATGTIPTTFFLSTPLKKSTNHACLKATINQRNITGAKQRHHTKK